MHLFTMKNGSYVSAVTAFHMYQGSSDSTENLESSLLSNLDITKPAM